MRRMGCHPERSEWHARAVVALLLMLLLPTRSDAQGFWTKLETSEENVKTTIWNSLAEGSFNPPALPALRTMPASARNSLITQMTTYAKTWTKSADFKVRYAEFRDERKPAAAAGDQSMAQRKKEAREQIQSTIKQMESSLKQVPAEAQPAIREMIQTQKDQLKEIDNPNNPMFSKGAEEGMSVMNEAAKTEHAQAMKEWETKYPVSPAPVIRESLRAFLAMSADVDFNATLVRNSSGVSKFTNSDYEAKPNAWKALYRAGKETTTALRAAAQQWLNELK